MRKYRIHSFYRGNELKKHLHIGNINRFCDLTFHGSKVLEDVTKCHIPTLEVGRSGYEKDTKLRGC